LIPIDGSKLAHVALEKGVELAKIHDSEVEILHVTTSSESYTPLMSTQGHGPQKGSTPPEWITEYMENIRQTHKQMLDDSLKYAKKAAPDLDITTKLLTGGAADNILDESKRGKFDLIIIGSRGLGGLRGFVLGSVSHNVVNRSKIPVLIIK
jgi:nucleotide-binding universal stress UspA family protein